MRTRSVLFAIFLSVCVVTGLFAQETRASLRGTVTDSSGSVIPAANITLTNSETGVALTATTNEAGLYRFLFLNPGKYQLTVAQGGTTLLSTELWVAHRRWKSIQLPPRKRPPSDTPAPPGVS